jgi:hypothetical protein
MKFPSRTVIAATLLGVLVAAFVGRDCYLGFVSARTLDVQRSLDTRWFYIFRAAVVLGLAVAVLSYTTIFAWVRGSAAQDRIDRFFKAVAPVAVLAFFIYQVLAGAFSSTTSVRVETTAEGRDSTSVVLKVTLERGDNWVAEIEQVSFSVTPFECL